MKSSTTETDDERSIEYASVKFLLKQVYAAHTSKVKELESEIQNLKQQLDEEKRHVASFKSECTKCKKLEMAFAACKEECKNAIHEQTKKLNHFEQLLAEKSEGNSETDDDAVVEETVLEREEDSINLVSESLHLKNSENKMSSKFHVADSTSEVPHFRISASSSKAASNCESMLDTTVTLLDDAILVPDSLDVSMEGQKCLQDIKNSTPNLKKGSNVKADVKLGKENSLINDAQFKMPKLSLSKKRALSELNLNEKLPSSKKLSTKSKQSSLVPVKYGISEEKQQHVSNKENSSRHKDDELSIPASEQSGKWAELFHDFSDSNFNHSVTDKTNKVSKSSEKEDFIMKNYEENGSWKSSSQKNGHKKPASVKAIKCTSRFKMTLEAPNFSVKRPNFKQTKLSLNCLVPPKVSEEDNVCEIIEVLECVDSSMANVSELARLAASNTNASVQSCDNYCSTSANAEHYVSAASETLCPLELIAQNKPLEMINDAIYQGTGEDGKEEGQMYDSFDRVPVEQEPTFKYKEDPVRNKNKRKQLEGFQCKECEKYYTELGISEEEKKQRMKNCSRHRAKYVPPATPDHFWELDFPDTEECKARGYVGETQKVQLKSRRRRPLISE